VLQKEAAHRYAGAPRSTRGSVLAAPRFEIEVVRSFRRSDFDPEPGVECVLLRIARRDRPLVPPARRGLYERFVRYGFGRKRRNLRQNLKGVFTHTQWRRLCVDLGFDTRARPGDVTFRQWLGLYRFFVEGVARSQVGMPEELR
jgi:16S rRNA A1518/A1519 N6-dimethyltransferase RsmA/KsgA/DIM1 with predicted DNA glycosylase/AP lyase activity